MTSLTRSTSRTHAYKDYVNFLQGYKNGKKEEENSDSGVSSKSCSSTGTSPLNSDVTDFGKNSCVSYNTFLENTKNKKFNPVKPTLEEKTTKRSEIFIEIQPQTSVSEVSKLFENKENTKSHPKNNKINSKISIFETKQERPQVKKIAKVPPLPIVNVENIPPPPINTETNVTPPPISTKPLLINSPKSKIEVVIPPPPPPPPVNTQTHIPPPPPPMKNAPLMKPPMTNTPKMQATLNKGPQVTHTVANPNGTLPATLDKDDPMVRKLVYGTLRGLYGAYHNKANDILANLPKSRVTKSNGVQDIIEKIASNGDLEKLNGRVNPKLEQE